MIRSIFFLFILLYSSSVVYSDTMHVICVPWISTDPDFPHETWNNKEITLKAVVYDEKDALSSYSWNFGNGTSTTQLFFSSPFISSPYKKYNVEIKAKYSGIVGQNYTAVLTVWNSSGHNMTDTYNILIKDATNETKVNVAIDEGLWYLHKNVIRGTTDGQGTGHWLATYPNRPTYYIEKSDFMKNIRKRIEHVFSRFQYIFNLNVIMTLGIDKSTRYIQFRCWAFNLIVLCSYLYDQSELRYSSKYVFA